MKNRLYRMYALILTTACIHFSCSYADAITLADVPDTVIKNLDAGVHQDVIVLYDDQDVEKVSGDMRRMKALDYDDDTIMSFKAGRYKTTKDSIEADFSTAEMETVTDYSHLPMRLHRFKSRAALDKFLLRPEIKAVYEDKPVYPHLASSLPFIGQPAVANAGYTGSGQTVLVIDTGIDYTNSAFGSCTAPGVPAGCRVVAAVDASGANDTSTPTNNHGTNVSGIVAGVAPGAKIASYNALPGGAGSDSTVIAGINWAISKKSTYNITTINMSLGDSSNNTSYCSSSNNKYITPISNALKNQKILTVASSGNNGFKGGISSPACTPGVISVGAVYDSSIGGWSYGTTCTDLSSAADQITCFSNIASFLTMLAPGAQVTAAGITDFGTSQASPHVAGAVAVLRAAYPADSPAQIQTRLTSTGVKVTSGSITIPRLNLLAAIGTLMGVPANDLFRNRSVISGTSGQITADNLNATKETGEPNHAGVSGGKSVWWSWTAPSSGVIAIDTHGSNFDTLLAVYTGTVVTGLTSVASNDNDGSAGNTSGVSFTAQAGTTYQIAVDGVNGAAGMVLLNWSLTQQADLALVMSGPSSPVTTGDIVSYSLVVTNNGPSDSVGVTLINTTPSGSIIDAVPTGCTVNLGMINCTIGTLLSGGSVASNISLHFTAPGDYLNTTQVSATTADPVLTNNSASFSQTSAAPIESVPGMPLPLAALTALLLALLAAHGTSEKISPGAA